MHQDLTLKEIQKEWHGSLKAYIIGFVSGHRTDYYFLFFSDHAAMFRSKLTLCSCWTCTCPSNSPTTLFLARRTGSQTSLGDTCILFHGCSSAHYCYWISLDYA